MVRFRVTLQADNAYWHQSTVVLDELPGSRHRAAQRLPARDHAAQVLGATTPFVAGATDLLPETPVTLAAGAPVTVADLTGPATIQSIDVRVADA